MTIEAGNQAPDFTLPADGGDEIALSDLRGRKVILYFYPKDDTPGCTKEACGFRDAMPDFSAVGAEVIGASKDSVVRHDRFREKYDLPFRLVSDSDGRLCEAWGTWVEKSMYGRKYMGIERATFLIDEQGMVRRVWRKVKVKGHVEEVIEAARAL